MFPSPLVSSELPFKSGCWGSGIHAGLNKGLFVWREGYALLATESGRERNPAERTQADLKGASLHRKLLKRYSWSVQRGTGHCEQVSQVTFLLPQTLILISTCPLPGIPVTFLFSAKEGKSDTLGAEVLCYFVPPGSTGQKLSERAARQCPPRGTGRTYTLWLLPR